MLKEHVFIKGISVYFNPSIIDIFYGNIPKGKFNGYDQEVKFNMNNKYHRQKKMGEGPNFYLPSLCKGWKEWKWSITENSPSCLSKEVTLWIQPVSRLQSHSIDLIIVINFLL